MRKGRLLAIDYGARHIGLAVSDPDRMMAFGRGKLLNKNIEHLLAQLLSLVEVEAVSKILIGLPLGPDREETEQTSRIRQFAAKLGNYLAAAGLDLEMEFVDESFSSYEAGRMLDELGVPARRKKSTEDELAAVVLIRRYIDFRP